MRARVLTGGQVFDGRHHLGARAVAVADGRVVAVGDEAEVLERAGAGADVVDVHGALLAPAFLDAHMHPMIGGLERLRCELTDLHSKDDYLDAIARHLAEQPDAEWFRGGGWSIDVFGPHGPTAAELDAVVPDRPAFVVSADHHNAWVNTKALEVAGIDEHTPDPPDGWFERDERGRPTGTVREAAMAMVGDLVDTSRAEYLRGLMEAQRHLRSLGITGWHDALIGGYAGIDDPTQAYLDAIEAGTLTAHVRASLWWDRHRGLEQVDELRQRRERLREAGLDAGSVKLMVDGIAETFTAAVTEPYVRRTGCRCGDSGLAFLAPEQLQEAVRALDAAGFAAHFHAIGDRAVHDALDAVERAREANGRSGHLHQIAHLQLVRPEDRRRFAELGVTANLEGMWAVANTPAVQLLAPYLDPERMSWHYPFGEIAQHGAALAGGSDWPVNPPEPVQAIHALVNRCGYAPDGQAADPLVPEQGLSLEQAMGAYTLGAAEVNGWQDLGRLAPGARADLVVLDPDPFEGGREEIGASTVRTTYVGGLDVSDGSC
jgi:predicted amidohydrolase YtcJ